MRIGFIGGIESGKSRVSVAVDPRSRDLKWEVRCGKPSQLKFISVGFENTINIPVSKDTDRYNLMILKKSGEMKFFYVLKGLEKALIQKKMNEYWFNSDILGYDFD